MHTVIALLIVSAVLFAASVVNLVAATSVRRDQSPDQVEREWAAYHAGARDARNGALR